MALVDKMLEKFALDQRVLLVPIVCVDDSPFTVSVGGGATAIPARRVAGQTFSIGDRGMALWLPPSPPICFETL